MCVGYVGPIKRKLSCILLRAHRQYCRIFFLSTIQEMGRENRTKEFPAKRERGSYPMKVNKDMSVNKGEYRDM